MVVANVSMSQLGPEHSKILVPKFSTYPSVRQLVSIVELIC